MEIVIVNQYHPWFIAADVLWEQLLHPAPRVADGWFGTSGLGEEDCWNEFLVIEWTGSSSRYLALARFVMAGFCWKKAAGLAAARGMPAWGATGCSGWNVLT